MIAIRQPLFEGAGVRDPIHSLISKYVGATMYTASGRVLPRLQRDLIRLLARELIPRAQVVGKEATGPILRVLKGSGFTQKGNKLRGAVLEGSRLYSRRNLAGLETVIEREIGTLSGDIKAAFVHAQRDGVARTTLVETLVTADRAEMTRLREVADEVKDAQITLTKAERTASRASARQQRKAATKVRKARAALIKAKGKRQTAKTFLARAETAIQGQVRDSIRREAEQASYRAFQQAGYRTFSWVTVNGADACPDCEPRHGWTFTSARWRTVGVPGSGHTVCQASCQCILVPAAYTKGRPGLENSVRVA